MTAVEKGDGAWDKERTSHDDLFDAFRMSLRFWHCRQLEENPFLIHRFEFD